tara:strand:+ start:4459 stop:7971 length:3513 start_codon:yes stop_codon:yes gene_type:complete
MSIPSDNKEPNVKNSNDQQGDFFTVDSYTTHQDVNKQPSNELVKGFHSQINPVTNPDEEFVQLASAGKFTNHLSKLLGFEDWSVLSKSKEIQKSRNNLINKGVDPDEFKVDDIVIDKSWENYMQLDEKSILANPNDLIFNSKNQTRIDNGKILMENAKRGKIDKRSSVAVLDLGNGKYEVLDGNTTVGIAQKSEWNEIPIRVFKSKEEHAQWVKDNKKTTHDQDELNHPLETAKKNVNKNANIDSSVSGVANNKNATDAVDGTTLAQDFVNDKKVESEFFRVGGKLDNNGKNIFGETEAEELANKLANNKDNQLAQVDTQGNLIDFRAFGLNKGEVNYDDAKIPNENTVYTAINEISKNGNYKNRIKDGDREHITNTALKELADLVGLNPEKLESTILKRHNGGVFNVEGAGLAETMLAARQLLVNEVNKLDGLAAKAVDGTDADKLAFRAQLELVAQIQAQIKGSQTEIARALQQFRVPLRSGQGTKLKAEDASQLLEEHGGGDNIRDIAQAYMQSGDMVNRLAMARQSSKFKKMGDALYEAWINILLSSPVTHVKNVTGAFLQTFAHVGESFVQVGVNRAGMMMGGKDSGIRMSDVHASMYGMIMSMSDAWKMAGNGFKYGEKAIAGSKIQGGGAKFKERAWSSDDNSPWGSFVNITGRFATLDRIPTKMLEFEDNFFKVMAQRQYIYENAMRTGRSKGLNGDALAHHIAEFVTNPPANILKEADSHARYITLQSNLKGWGKNLQGVRNNSFMRYFIPFFKTPYNATKYALGERTILAQFTENYRSLKAKAKQPNATMEDKRLFQKAQTKMHMGNATAMTIMYFASQGNITGSGPSDPDLRKRLTDVGWKPYSIKIGDTYYSYQGAEPFSSIIGIAADGAEVMFDGKLSDEENENIAMAITVMLSNQITDKTFMQGFSQLVSTISDPERYGGNMAESYIRSLVPRAVALAQKEQDGYVRYSRTYIDSLKSQIPWLSESLEPRRNVWGMKIMVGDTFGPGVLSPIYSSTLGENYRKDKGTVYMPNRGRRAWALDKEFIDKQTGIRWAPSKHPEALNIPKIGEIELNDQEISLYHEVSGMYLIEELERVINSEDYQKLKTAWLKTGKKNDLIKDKLHLWLSKGQLEARNKAITWMLTNEENPNKDLLNARIEEIGDLMQKEADATNQLVN